MIVDVAGGEVEVVVIVMGGVDNVVVMKVTVSTGSTVIVSTGVI